MRGVVVWLRSPAESLIRALLALFLSLACHTQLLAHGVNLFAYVEGDRIIAQGYFSKSRKTVDCRIEVYDSSGSKLLEGRTDDQGVFSFNRQELPPAMGNLKLVLHAGEGHRAEYTVEAKDLGDNAGGLPHKDSAPQAAPSMGKDAPARGPTDAPTLTDIGALRQTIAEVVRQENQALIRMLGKQQEMLLEAKNRGPGVPEVIGGLGWILGIMGAAAYFKSRRPGSKQ
jgi:nickel transport protein